MNDEKHMNVSDIKERRIRTDHMAYMEGMEVIPHDTFDKVIAEMNSYNPNDYSEEDVQRAIKSDSCSVEDFKALLSPAADVYLEKIAEKASIERRKHFGNVVNLFTPLYISNYCENYCVYCGFNCHNKIHRARLNSSEIEKEMKAIAESGLEEILILTGESRSKSDIEYIGEACKMGRKYFKNIGIEVYPMNSDEYAYLKTCGADYVTVFQETYNSDEYEKLHLAGHKRIFPYRFNAQERALMGGMRGVGFAALLGLDDFRKDALATGLHAYLMQRKYPWAEISLSCPRLRPIISNNDEGTMFSPNEENEKVQERQLLQVICAYRIFLPFAAITISTRERAGFRDNVMGITATKISAGVDTGIGSHSDDETSSGDNQFEIADGRSVDEICAALREHGMQPVMNDYVYV